jgi:Helicase associated domain
MVGTVGTPHPIPPRAWSCKQIVTDFCTFVSSMIESLRDLTALPQQTLVPFQYVADKSLGRWVNEQRCQHMRGLLREDRREILSRIGFVWKVNSRKGELTIGEEADDKTQWGFSFRQLVEWKNSHGSFPVDSPFAEQDFLAQWASEQRQWMIAGELEESKAQRLAAIGFCDAGDDKIWDTNYGKLQRQGYESIYSLQDPCLSHWVILQRYLYKKDKLLPERKMLLFDIPGFAWDSTPLNFPKPITKPESKHILKEKQRNVCHPNEKENKKPSLYKINSKETTAFGTATTLEKSKPVKKRKPVFVDSSSLTTQAEENEGFCGLLAIASSFRAKEELDPLYLH